MEATLLEAATAAWIVVSALAVAALGLAAFAGGSSRPPGSVAFGAFAILWGAHAVAGQWMAFAPAGSVARAHLVYLAFLLPLPYFLVELAAAYAARSGSGPAWRTLRAAALAAPLAAVVILLARPALLYQGPRYFEESGYAYPAWGPLFPFLAIAPFYAALGLALWAFDAQRRAAPTARTALRHALVAGGLGAFTAFAAGNNLAFFLADLVALGRHDLAEPYLLVFLALGAVVLLVGLRAWRDARREPSRKVRDAAALVALATLAPFAWGAAEGLLAYSVLPHFSTVGLWRLVGVALLGYALARWHIADLEARTRRAATTAAGVAGAAIAGGLTVGVCLLALPGTGAALVAGAAVPVATLAPSLRLARRAIGPSENRVHSDADLARRLDTYRAALEASLARRTLEGDAGFLAGLRRRLAISDDVHEALLALARSSVLPPPGAPLAGFERLRLLGEGAEGRAWLARRLSDDELVVLKEPLAADRRGAAELMRQAKLVRALRHENLARVEEVVAGAQGVFLVMEFVPGGSLADRLAEGPLAPAEAVRHVRGVLRGLDALHARGVVHGDVKPANVLLAADGAAKLADFGLARACRPDAADATRTFVGVEGTLSALAPEQVAGAPATPASDVYAAGALLYRLLTGEHYVALRGLSDTEARERVRALHPALPHPLVPPPLDAVVARALAKDPAERFPSARAMREALEAS